MKRIRSFGGRLAGSSDASRCGDDFRTMAEVCPRCGTEFLLGSGFCHSCGGRRQEAISLRPKADAAEMAGLWEQAVARVRSVAAGFTWSKIKFPSWMRYLHFHEIKSWVGLSTASLIAFMIGLACIAGALLVGLLTAKNVRGLAGHPVLSRGMAAGGNGLVRGGDSAKEVFQPRQRVTAGAEPRKLKLHLLRQAQSPYQGLVSRIGTDRVKRGIADAENHFNFLVGNRSLQIVERPVPVARNRKRQSRPGSLLRLVECA